MKVILTEEMIAGIVRSCISRMIREDRSILPNYDSRKEDRLRDTLHRMDDVNLDRNMSAMKRAGRWDSYRVANDVKAMRNRNWAFRNGEDPDGGAYSRVPSEDDVRAEAEYRESRNKWTDYDRIYNSTKSPHLFDEEGDLRPVWDRIRMSNASKAKRMDNGSTRAERSKMANFSKQPMHRRGSLNRSVPDGRK